MRRSPEQLAILQNQMRARWQAGSVRSRPGRPARQLDADMAFVLALHGMTHAEIAQHFRCDRKTLERRCGAVLRRAARRRAMLLPRSLWQRGSASNLNLAAIEAELEAHCLNFEQLENMVAQDSAENNRARKYRNSASNKQQISATGNAGMFAPQKNNSRINEHVIEQLPIERTHGFSFPDQRHVPQPPMSDISKLQQKIAGDPQQAKHLSPKFFPNAPLPNCTREALARGDHKNTLEPPIINGKAIAPNISESAPAPKPVRRPWRIVEVLW